jgi:hypothetical protein
LVLFRCLRVATGKNYGMFYFCSEGKFGQARPLDLLSFGYRGAVSRRLNDEEGDHPFICWFASRDPPL